MNQPVSSGTAEALPLAPGLQGIVADWSSDQRAFKNVPWGKAMMWIFLLSDTFIFSSFLISYMTVRISTTVPWPNPSEVFGLSIGGLMDPEYIDQPMSWGKTWSVLQHLVIPVIVIGMSGTAGMIRRLRANLLDELQKQYVVTGRAKGLPPLRLLIKYPLRHAINPFVADIGGLLPEVISGSVIVSVVLSLPTTGPMLLGALKTQDVNLAATFLLFVATLTVVGMLVSDLALAALDPRIRFGASSDK